MYHDPLHGGVLESFQKDMRIFMQLKDLMKDWLNQSPNLPWGVLCFWFLFFFWVGKGGRKIIDVYIGKLNVG